MKASQKCFELIESEEGLKNHVYKDQAGYPSIGVGHKLTPLQVASGNLVIKGESVRYANGLTDQQCYDLLAQDVIPAENAVNKAVKVTLNQNQFDCLVDFCYNAGGGAFAGSTLLKLLNEGNYDAVPDQLLLWDKCHINGVLTELDDLKNRRIKEGKLWLSEI